MSHEPIHSGHFMTSNPHTDLQQDEEDEDVEVDVVEDDDKPEDITGSASSKDRAGLDEKPVTFYKFGPKKTQSIAIDVSLNKLNKCIKVAYNKMTTPKWKDFKGLRLHWKQRIRLNNVIWRAYYIEFGRKHRKLRPKKTPFCYFAVPDDDTTHIKIEGSVMEGMYWKRRMEAVCAQYKRWRHFTKTKRSHEKPIASGKRKRHDSEGVACSLGEPMIKLQRSQTPKNTSTECFDNDDFENVFTDSLFDSLSQPYMFPNPREMMQSGNADIMQPGLLPLQPSLEDIMATFDGMDSLRSETPPTGPAHPINPSPPLFHHHHHHNSSSSSQRSSSRLTPPTTVAPPPLEGQGSVHRSPDYAAASMLVDYSNQSHRDSPAPAPMPTRQSSSITSQMLMLSSAGVQPQYSTATYDQNWRTTGLLLGDALSSSALSASTSDYSPQFQFLQTQHSQHAGLLPATHSMSMSNPSSMRNWWAETPLGQSPLSVSLGGSHTPLGPATPLATGLDNVTPPMMRSPVVCLPAGNSVVTEGQKTGLARRLEQPSLLVPPQGGGELKMVSQEGKSSSPFPRPSSSTKEWSSRMVSPALPYGVGMGGVVRPAPSSSDSRRTDGPWKLANLEPTTPIYPSYSREMSSSTLSSEGTRTPGNSPENGPAGSSMKVEGVLKEEGAVDAHQLMSAPPSVKRAKTVSRQVPADSTLHPEERKRILHLHAEQNRRSALKDGFDQLMEMIPDLYSGGVKPTNAVVLAKSAEHIRRLAAIKEEQLAGQTKLQQKIDKLNGRINSLQSNMPSTSGLPGGGMKPDSKASMEAFYERYTRERSKQDWRFWVMSRMLHPLLVGQNTSFSSVMALEGASREELAASCSDWLNQHWKAPELRPLASTLLVHLATNTNVLTSPESLAAYVNDQLKNPTA